jgi:hypothetical protein
MGRRQRRFSGRIETVKTVANQIVETESALRKLSVSDHSAKNKAEGESPPKLLIQRANEKARADRARGISPKRHDPFHRKSPHLDHRHPFPQD